MLQSKLSISNVQLELFVGAIDLFAMVGALPMSAPTNAPTKYQQVSRCTNESSMSAQADAPPDAPTSAHADAPTSADGYD